MERINIDTIKNKTGLPGPSASNSRRFQCGHGHHPTR